MSSEPVKRPVSILMIEDNRGDVLLVREALNEAALDFELAHVSDGEEALNYLLGRGKYADIPRPHIVLLDLNLPKRDGWEILDIFRSSPRVERIPVVILSSSGNPEDRARADGIPAAIFIRKPSTLDEFMSVGRQIAELWSRINNVELLEQ